MKNTFLALASHVCSHMVSTAPWVENLGQRQQKCGWTYPLWQNVSRPARLTSAQAYLTD